MKHTMAVPTRLYYKDRKLWTKKETAKYADVPFTAKETAEAEAKAVADLKKLPMNTWLGKMEASDNDLPRWAENIIDFISSGQPLSQQTIKLSTDKKELRRTKP